MSDVVAMTYNIRNGHPDAGHDWSTRAPLVAEVVRRNAPDVLGAQEVLLRQLRDLHRLLPEYDVHGQGRDGGDEGEFGPVFWRRDRFVPVDAGQFWLSDTPDVVGSNTWNGLCTRCATWVRLRDVHDGAEFVFANTHLDHEESSHGDEVRTRSARLIAERLDARPGLAAHPIVLTGDVNETPDGPAHAALAAAGLAEAGGGPTRRDPTFHDPTFHDYGRAERPARIDGIFVTIAVRVLGEFVDAAGVARAASDHYPVVARLRIPS